MGLSLVFHLLLGLVLYSMDAQVFRPSQDGPMQLDLVLGEVESSSAIARVKNLATTKKQVPHLDAAIPVNQAEAAESVNESSRPVVAASGTAGFDSGLSSGVSSGTAETELSEVESNYLKDLRLLLESKKEYPMAARRMGHRGRVVVRFVLERDGRVRAAKIIQSSQSEILNRAARGLIEGLHDVKPFPKEVAFNEWAVVVPIEYQM